MEELMSLMYRSEMPDCCKATLEASEEDFACDFCDASYRLIAVDGAVDGEIIAQDSPPRVDVAAVILVNRSHDALHAGHQVLWRNITHEQAVKVC